MPERDYSLRTTAGRGFYVMSLGVHGLVCADNIELGRDADTGGQTAYMVDQARAMASHAGVDRVDLVTRLIRDKRVSERYSKAEEPIEAGARIVRLPFGPRRYLHKENLWPYLDAAVDQLLRYVRALRRGPDVIHGHYADAGYVGSRLAKILAVPFVFTGHSLGRVKRMRLEAEGASPDALNERYRFDLRIEAEEQALETASLVIASTHQEVRTQYELYDHYHPERMTVIPPGVDLRLFHPPASTWDDGSIRQLMRPFLRDMDKPIVLALARPDERKNVSTLIRAYADNLELRERANLVLVMGARRNISEMEAGSKRVLREMLDLIDRHDLYGSVAYPKQLQPRDVPDLYRFVRKSRGLLVNPALTEPFGLTLIEAAATGLPVVATSDGGPQDILKICSHGKLVDPLDAEEMGNVILSMLRSERRWDRWSENGVANVHNFSWQSHVDKYLNVTAGLLRGKRSSAQTPRKRSPLPRADRMLVADLDDTLIGDAEALKSFSNRLGATRDLVAFVVVTERSLESAAPILDLLETRHPEVVVTDSGTEIHYGWPDPAPDEVWSKHVDHDWRPTRVREALGELPGIRVVTTSRNASRFRVACHLNPKRAPSLAVIRKHLRQSGLRVATILDRGRHLDVLPIRATPGLALRFLGGNWICLPSERSLRETRAAMWTCSRVTLWASWSATTSPRSSI